MKIKNPEIKIFYAIVGLQAFHIALQITTHFFSNWWLVFLPFILLFGGIGVLVVIGLLDFFITEKQESGL